MLTETSRKHKTSQKSHFIIIVLQENKPILENHAFFLVFGENLGKDELRHRVIHTLAPTKKRDSRIYDMISHTDAVDDRRIWHT